MYVCMSCCVRVLFCLSDRFLIVSLKNVRIIIRNLQWPSQHEECSFCALHLALFCLSVFCWVFFHLFRNICQSFFSQYRWANVLRAKIMWDVRPNHMWDALPEILPPESDSSDGSLPTSLEIIFEKLAVLPLTWLCLMVTIPLWFHDKACSTLTFRPQTKFPVVDATVIRT